MSSVCDQGSHSPYDATNYQLLGTRSLEHRLKAQHLKRSHAYSLAVFMTQAAATFPSRAIADIRDDSDAVVDEHNGRDVNGRRYKTQTRWGQRRLSRILSRVESEIFLQRALVRLYREYGVRAVPIHGCLMVAERHAEVARLRRM